MKLKEGMKLKVKTKESSASTTKLISAINQRFRQSSSSVSVN